MLFNLPVSEQRRRILRRNRSRAEIRLWRHLRNRLFDGLRFRRQYGIGPYFVDLYCPRLELAIEIDGDSHYRKSVQEYDRRRTDWLRKQGIRVIRFTNEEVMQDIEGVLMKLRRFIQSLPNSRNN